MIYENYTLAKYDIRNWTLEKVVAAIRSADAKDKDGAVIAKKGDSYNRTVFLGYHGNVFDALTAIIRDKAGVGCDDIKALSLQMETMNRELKELTY